MATQHGLQTWRWRLLERRLASLESRPPPPPPAGKDLWDRLQVVMPMVNGIVLALVAWWISGAVELALKRDQLQLAQATEMQALIKDLTLQEIEPASATAAALTLAAYGKPAVAPLLAVLLERNDEVRGPAVEAALRSVGLVQPDAVCEPLTTLLQSRSQRFGWTIKDAVVRLLGDSRCIKAKPLLAALSQRLASADVRELADDFAALPTFDPASVAQLQKSLTESLRSLGATR